MGRPSRTLESVAKELLEKSIKNGECLECHLAPSTTGYGQTYYGSAHRVVWCGLFGETNLNVLHTCDNRICINPHHLFLGTIQDNVNDMIAKGRKNNVPQRIIAADVRDEMKRLQSKGLTYQEIANKFYVSRNTVWRNLRGYYD